MRKEAVSGDIIGVALRQMGATEIKVFQSRTHIANFDLDDGLQVSYVFNITRKEKYFLQRMRPYAMVKGMYADQKEIIEFIRDDIARFRKSVTLNNVDMYMQLNEKINGIYQRVEHIFLHHEIDDELVKKLTDEVERMAVEIEDIHKQSEIINMKQ